MKFYTSVEQTGNTILVRGYDHGLRFEDRVKFNPTLFLPSKLEEEWKTLDGRNVRPVQQGSIVEAKSFMEAHRDLEDYEICGQTRFLNQYIFETYPDEDMKFDMNQIRIFYA